MKGNVVTKLLVTLNFKFNVTDIPVTIPLHSTVLFSATVGRSLTVPLWGSHTRSPIGPTAGPGHRTGRHPEVSPRDGGPSPGTARIERTRSNARAHANVPLSVGTPTGRDTIGTARERTHTSLTSSLRPARWPTIGLTRLHDRLPLLAASACRARAQLKLPPARLMQDISRAGRGVLWDPVTSTYGYQNRTLTLIHSHHSGALDRERSSSVQTELTGQITRV